MRGTAVKSIGMDLKLGKYMAMNFTLIFKQNPSLLCLNCLKPEIFIENKSNHDYTVFNYD